jgi:branched-chain amino acid aminotransferase/4-amino-4-deoxychorismate lyase
LDGVPLDDRGLLLGDGLFETLLWSGGGLVLGEDHARRMIRGAAALGLPPPGLGDFLAVARSAVADAGLGDARAAVRVTLTAGSGGRGLERPADPAPRLFATAAPAARPTEPAVLAIAGSRRNAASPTSRLKTLAYLDNVLARREARAAGADEAVMLNTDGHLAGAAAANLFWIEGEILATPPPAAGCLDGILRAAVLAAAARLGVAARETIAGPDALHAAQAVFITNSLIGVRPVRRLGERVLAPHALVDRLAHAVAAVS